MAKKLDTKKNDKTTTQTNNSGEKTYVYIVKVFDKNKNVICVHNRMTQKEIERLKKTFKDGESVRYMPIDVI